MQAIPQPVNFSTTTKSHGNVLSCLFQAANCTCTCPTMPLDSSQSTLSQGVSLNQEAILCTHSPLGETLPATSTAFNEHRTSVHSQIYFIIKSKEQPFREIAKQTVISSLSSSSHRPASHTVNTCIVLRAPEGTFSSQMQPHVAAAP